MRPAADRKDAHDVDLQGDNGARGETHGDYTAQSTFAQALKDLLRSAPGWSHLRPFQREALEHDATRKARILFGDQNHPDHWLDIEGYARLVRERL